MLRLTNTASKSSHNESKMDSSMKHRYSAISEISSIKGTPKAIRAWLMELQQDSHVSHFQLQENEKVKKTKEICGLPPLNAFALYDLNSHSWKTSQVSFLTNTLDEFSETWPKQGMMQNGVCWELTMWVPPIEGKESGLWRTPDAWLGKRGPKAKNSYLKALKTGKHAINLLDQVIHGRKWPTPNARDALKDTSPKRDRLPDAVGSDPHGGKLNPDWVEWLMGWPIGWTDLKPLEMGKFQQWLQQHGRS